MGRNVVRVTTDPNRLSILNKFDGFFRCSEAEIFIGPCRFRISRGFCVLKHRLPWLHLFISGDIDGVGLLPVLYGVEEGDDMGLVVVEHFRQRDVELLVRLVIGPQGKDSPG